MPRLTIVIGGNGAGKSTWCSHHRDSLPKHFYNPDVVAEGIGGWNRRARQTRSGRARGSSNPGTPGEAGGLRVREHVLGAHAAPIVERAKALGYEVDAVFIGTRTAEINVERVAARVTSRTGHARAVGQQRRDHTTRRPHRRARHPGPGEIDTRMGQEVGNRDRRNRSERCRSTFGRLSRTTISGREHQACCTSSAGSRPGSTDAPISPESLIRLLRRWNTPAACSEPWTRRKPRRTAELEGGSVYFVARGWTHFRAPLVRIEPVRDFTGHRPVDPAFDDAWSLTCNPDSTLVESTRIHRLQGWRYLTLEAAPRDVEPDDANKLPGSRDG